MILYSQNAFSLTFLLVVPVIAQMTLCPSSVSPNSPPVSPLLYHPEHSAQGTHCRDLFFARFSPDLETEKLWGEACVFFIFIFPEPGIHSFVHSFSCCMKYITSSRQLARCWRQKWFARDTIPALLKLILLKGRQITGQTFMIN